MQEVDLKRLQGVLCEMLAELIGVMEKLNLRYFAQGGTVLGAVRHQGFIPWDDDIDIGLPREDYERLMAEGPDLLPPYYFLQDGRSDPEYPKLFAKLRDSRTTFVETCLDGLSINHGVYLDIFPLDGYPKRGLPEKLHKIRKCLPLWASMAKQGAREDGTAHTARNLKWGKWIGTTIYLGRSPAALREKMNQVLASCSFDASDEVGNLFGMWREREIMPRAIYGEGRLLPFENLSIRVPEDTDAYLTRLYGNYMEPPPPEKRVSHHVCRVVDFDRPYTVESGGSKDTQ